MGWGGGLVAEPMARLGAEVVAIDASATNIGVARTHAAESELAIDYRVPAAEALAAAGGRVPSRVCLAGSGHVAPPPPFPAATPALGSARGRPVSAAPQP